ncbi:WD repeat-containing protein 55 homolog [Orussus abietinus]|uniref:WD repeat-containing protein 55 homolog n=1 Tax=Orussus abietinus TaxID=222816 RepID=UPI000625240F|nr:WD repeat-containing protein 55 homolog [Orussus abietinus]
MNDNENQEDSNVSTEDDSETDSEEWSDDSVPPATISGIENLEEVIALNEDEEQDEVVKAIMKSKELHRDHPPVIVTEEFTVDLCFHPVDDLIALASITGDVLLYRYNNEETELVSTLELHLKACRDVEFSHDGKILYSTAKDRSIILTDLETEKLTRIYENAHEHPVYTMYVINENVFATGDDDGVVKLWDLRQRGDSPLLSLKEMQDYVGSMITTSDEKYLACSSGDGTLTTLNIRAKKMHVQSEEYDEELICLGLMKDETKLLTATSKGKMYVFNWGEFGYHSDEFPTVTKKPINSMVTITDTVVITGGDDGLLRGTSLFPHRQLGVVGQHKFSIEALDVCNDGTLIASCSHDNEVKFWNVKYFETLDASEPIKGGKQKRMKHNLPSSKVDNAKDFFANL